MGARGPLLLKTLHLFVLLDTWDGDTFADASSLSFAGERAFG
jgi:hypothetical protein